MKLWFLFLCLLVSDLIPWNECCGCGGGGGGNNQVDYFPLLLGYLLAALAGASGRKAARNKGIAIDDSHLEQEVPARQVCSGYWAKKECKMVVDPPLFVEGYDATPPPSPLSTTTEATPPESPDASRRLSGVFGGTNSGRTIERMERTRGRGSVLQRLVAEKKRRIQDFYGRVRKLRFRSVRRNPMGNRRIPTRINEGLSPTNTTHNAGGCRGKRCTGKKVFG